MNKRSHNSQDVAEMFSISLNKSLVVIGNRRLVINGSAGLFFLGCNRGPPNGSPPVPARGQIRNKSPGMEDASVDALYPN
jgi:hypothetical protein